jgi:hypothetical protein
MAGLAPAIHVFVELNRLRDNCQKGKPCCCKPLRPAERVSDSSLTTARRGWPGQALAVTVEALRRGRDRLAKTQGVLDSVYGSL